MQNSWANILSISAGSSIAEYTNQYYNHSFWRGICIYQSALEILPMSALKTILHEPVCFIEDLA